MHQSFAAFPLIAAGGYCHGFLSNNPIQTIATIQSWSRSCLFPLYPVGRKKKSRNAKAGSQLLSWNSWTLTVVVFVYISRQFMRMALLVSVGRHRDEQWRCVTLSYCQPGLIESFTPVTFILCTTRLSEVKESLRLIKRLIAFKPGTLTKNCH